MLIFGGWEYSDQISQIGNCGITRIGTLPFDFEYGGCTNLNEPNGEFILLCFPDGQKRACYR